MKRTPFLIAVPVMIGVAFLLLLLALMSRVVMRPSPWREQVDYYLQSSPGMSFVSAKQAAQPKEFRPEMSGPVYSRSQSSADSRSSTAAARSAAAALAAVGAGQLPMPYPPEDVWCVTLARQGGAQTMVFVALHVFDMYTSEWVTHEAAGDATATAATIGCR